jgi:hypothetical protein
VFIELEIVSSTEKVVETPSIIEPTTEAVDHIDAEALPLVNSNTGELVGMVVGGILSAVAITSLVG